VAVYNVINKQRKSQFMNYKGKQEITPFFIFAFVLLSLFQAGNAQLISSTADFSDTLSYRNFEEKDKLFVFISPPTEETLGQLTATWASKTGPLDFTWSRYDTASHNFIPFTTDADVVESSVTGLEDGGYQVIVNDTAGMDTTMRGWVFINNEDSVTVEVEKGNNNDVPFFRSTCSYLDIRAKAAIDTFYYYNPQSNQRVELENPLTISWRSEPEYPIPANGTRLQFITFDPPPFDAHYYLTISDKFGIEKEDDVEYESIVTNAEFDIEVRGYFEDEFSSDDLSGSAPLTARFTNLSQNGEEFEWHFLDTTLPYHDDPELITLDSIIEPEFIYRIPRNYYVKLYSTSEAGCLDSFTLEDPAYPGPIIVEESHLEIANYFVIGSGTNFKVDDRSLRSFKMLIFNRYGRKVYEYVYNEANHADWEGWDGKVDKNNYASSGVYYYVIEAYGWDREKYEFPGEVFKGFFHVFHQGDLN